MMQIIISKAVTRAISVMARFCISDSMIEVVQC